MCGGVLHVWGDSADNRIWISSAGDDTAVIVSLDGTTLNGGRVPLWFDGIKFAHSVRLLGGNDFLYVSGLTGTAGLFIDTGHDNDGVSLEHVNLDGAIVNTGTGNDTVSVGGGKFNWTSFNLGVGDDRQSVFGTSFNGVAFNGGQGNDSLAVMAVKWNEFPLTTAFESVFGSLMPVANNDRFNVERGQSVTLNILANDRAILGILDPSTVTITRQPQHGTVTVNDNGTITYTTPAGLAAPRDSLRYTVRSSTGAVSNEATVTLVFPVVPDTTGPVTDDHDAPLGTRRTSRRSPSGLPSTRTSSASTPTRHHRPERDCVGLRGRSGQPALVHIHRHADRPGRGHGQRRRRRGRGQQGQRQFAASKSRDLRYHAADRDHRRPRRPARRTQIPSR